MIAGISLDLMKNCFSQSCQEILAKASAAWRLGKAQGKGRAAAVFMQYQPLAVREVLVAECLGTAGG